MIISDGWDRGDISTLREEMEALAAKLLPTDLAESTARIAVVSAADPGNPGQRYLSSTTFCRSIIWTASRRSATHLEKIEGRRPIAPSSALEAARARTVDP